MTPTHLVYNQRPNLAAEQRQFTLAAERPGKVRCRPKFAVLRVLEDPAERAELVSGHQRTCRVLLGAKAEKTAPRTARRVRDDGPSARVSLCVALDTPAPIRANELGVRTAPGVYVKRHHH